MESVPLIRQFDVNPYECISLKGQGGDRCIEAGADIGPHRPGEMTVSAQRNHLIQSRGASFEQYFTLGHAEGHEHQFIAIWSP